MSLSVPLEPPSKEILHISAHYLVILVKYIYSIQFKFAKFHGDSPSGILKGKFNLASVELNFPRGSILCTTLYRNPIQASNFCGAFDQLFL